MTMTSDILYIQLPNKCHVFLQTHTRRWYDITDCQPITDGGISDNNGVLRDARKVSARYVAELVGMFGDNKPQKSKSKSKSKRKASRIRRLQSTKKEEAAI
jgi:hypothetical protein